MIMRYLVLSLILTMFIGGCKSAGKHNSIKIHTLKNCIPESQIRSLSKKFWTMEEQQFTEAVLKALSQKGGELQNYIAEDITKFLPFGVPQLYVKEDGTSVVAVGLQKTPFRGVKVARTKEGGYLVFVAKPRQILISKTGWACKCQIHGGYHKIAQPPPAFFLPNADISKVQVITISYDPQRLQVRRATCPGLIP